ncbi:hypothetical protein A2246_04955 [candidate division WOR-1 bacterium RIFOXYA2_FULL_37_7]|nr:MAG: hypothetical protein A2246_04955 [candidate division WOR-1 bacterium RIFOXYA2_FULL_37_7]
MRKKMTNIQYSMPNCCKIILRASTKLLCICIFIIGFSSLAFAKEYDGVWFLGFNLHKDVFSNVKAREAIAHAINKQYITTKIMSEEVVPIGVIPPNMQGNDTTLKEITYNANMAKQLLKASGENRPKELTLLHTDGIKTKMIAETIKNNLNKIGIKINLKEVTYEESAVWGKALNSGKDHLFLMGYKINPFLSIFIGDKNSRLFHALGCDKIPQADDQEIFASYDGAIKSGYSPDKSCKPTNTGKTETEALIRPLLYSKGEANFTFFSNERVDALLDQLAQIDPALKEEQTKRLKEIDAIIYKELPIIPLFYIEKL